jgi:5-formyltetrahydrofolate cyclo-ligase
MGDRDREYEQLAALAGSDDPAEVDRAHETALIRMSKEPQARIVAALAYDRARALAGREQKFGTQSVICSGKRVLWPVDANTTDSERAKWHIQGLKRLREQVGQAPEITKVHLRRAARKRRDGLQAEELTAFADRIAEHGVPAVAVAASAVIAAYWPLPGEADPRPLARALAKRHGARLVLPVVNGDEMTFREWLDDAKLEPAGFGTFGPSSSAAERSPSIVLTPLLGFDKNGARLGQGKGFYDRKLALLAGQSDPLVVGIASSCQELSIVPTEAHDHGLHMVITELGVTKFGN